MLRLRILAPIAALAAALPIAVTSAQNGPASGSKPAARAQAPAGVSLFDGKTLQGWRGYKRPDATGSRWRAEDGMLTLDRDDGKDTRGARDIITTETFDLFDLTWEWKVSQGGNSGLKYFVLEDRDSAIGHEYQMIDDERHPDAKIGPHRQTAAFYDVLAAPQPRPLKPAGEWNTSRIRVAPSRVVPGSTRVYHYLNVSAGQPGDRDRHRSQQVQGHRALRQAAEGAHPDPGSWRSGVVQEYQDRQTQRPVVIAEAGRSGPARPTA
jgi:hypothetical protein